MFNVKEKIISVIEKKIDIPGLEVTLIVSSIKRYIFWGSNGWLIRMIMAGPDRRYNSAYEILTGRSLVKFIDRLKFALVQCEQMKYKGNCGVFKKRIYKNLELQVSNNEPHIKYSLKTDSYEFWRIWSVSNLKQIINQLEEVPKVVQQISLDFKK